MIEQMKAFARERGICVLATDSGGQPHCSLMAYVTDKDCREIYMVTLGDTRKFKNITQNPRISLLIDSRENLMSGRRSEAKAMTVEGVCERVTDRDQKEAIRTEILERHPYLRELAERSEAEFLRVRISTLLLLEGLTEAHFRAV